MKITSNSLRKTKSKPQRNRAEISLLVFIGVVAFIGLAAPFAHVFYNNSDVPGLFGFKSMSSFLFAIGFPILSVASGILFYLASEKLADSLRQAFRLISFTFIYVGVFFLVWVFIPSIQDFDPLYYYLSIIGVAFLVSAALWFFSKHVLGLAGKIGALIHLIGVLRVKYFFPMVAWAKVADKENEVIIEKQLADFDKEVFKTLKKVSK